MTAFLVRRFGAAVIVVLGVTTATFLIMHVTAGSYVPGLQPGPGTSPAQMAQLRADLGLDRPLFVQYIDWLGLLSILHHFHLAQGMQSLGPGLLEGSLGDSMVYHSSIGMAVLARLPNTLELTGAAILVGIIGAIFVGVISGVKRGTWLDRILSAGSVLGYAVPQFWLGLVAILVFSVILHEAGLPSLPSSGATSEIGGGGVGDRLAHLVLPALTLAFFYISTWSRFIRSSIVEIMNQDYIRTAQAKGMPPRRVLYVHALRNALTPLVTLIGLELPGLFSGAVVVEVVFGWPGIGFYAYEAAVQYDYTAVLGTTTFTAALVVLANLLADILYRVVDPRVEYE